MTSQGFMEGSSEPSGTKILRPTFDKSDELVRKFRSVVRQPALSRWLTIPLPAQPNGNPTRMKAACVRFGDPQRTGKVNLQVSHERFDLFTIIDRHFLCVLLVFPPN